MKFTKAGLSDVEILAEMNKRLIEDERHPNPMNVQQLTQRMSEWLQGEYTCYLATEDNNTVAFCLFRDDGEYYYLLFWKEVEKEIYEALKDNGGEF